jgi:ankyrin repeat protein
MHDRTTRPTAPAELVVAVEADDAETVRRLLGAEPALAGTATADGTSLVLHARYRFATAALTVLLAARGDDLDLFEAAACDRADIVARRLAAEPALAAAFAPDGFTALQLAAFMGSLGAVEALLDAGADVEAVARNPMAIRPLHASAAGRHLEISRRLVERGADVNAVQRDSFTPLGEAAQNGDLPLVELLLAAGADRSARTSDGRTPADLAEAAGHAQLAASLRA